MSLIYTDVPPLRLKDGRQNLLDYVKQNLSDADCVSIAVGYASKNALRELSDLVKSSGISHAELILGMYCIEGFPEGIYNTAVILNDEWTESGLGGVRIIPSMKYHGKVYTFYKNGEIFAGAVGSHNLGALSVDANNRRQYELSVCITDKNDLSDLAEHVREVSAPPVSVSIRELTNPIIIHSENEKLNDVEGVTKVDAADVRFFKQSGTDITFELPLKVPGIPGESNDYMKSNINKCYAKGRLNSKTGVVTERGWWETEVIVSNTITRQPDYPTDVPCFYVVTDDGWRFKAHVSGDHFKNFESHDDLKVLGYWLKGRLAAAGFVVPVDSPSADLENADFSRDDPYAGCLGVITYKKLMKYGRTSLTFTKTTQKLADEDGSLLDVWTLSFLPDNVK